MKGLLLFTQFIGLLLTILFALWGCGGSDLTGGSVPPGNPGQTRLIGTVVDEEDPSVPLADVEVEILLEDGKKIVAKTDSSGSFSVDLPINKRCTIRVLPPIGLSALYQERLDTFVTDASEIWLLIPVPRREMTMPQIPEFVNLQIQPEEVVLKVRESVRFQVQLTPSPHRPIRPVWSVHGGIGVVTADGLFVATRSGQGFVRVRIGHLRAEAKVTVLPQ